MPPEAENQEDNVKFDTIVELRQMRKALCDKPGSWTEIFRTLTPIGLFVAAFFLNTFAKDISVLSSDVRDMRVEVNKHLQNSEFHIPRSTVVSKDEFILYQTMRDRQMSDIRDVLSRIEDTLSSHVKR